MANIIWIMSRYRSTIYREVRQNWWHDKEVPQADRYWPLTAESLSSDRRACQQKLIGKAALFAAVTNQFRAGQSPK
ncbi:hypothetical protein [Pontivivens insulae]